MPSWHDLLHEIQKRGSIHDIVRRECLKKLAEKTKRNVILYYSGWLQKPGIPGCQVNDEDKNGFMTVIHRLDRSKGLDLILHTPGGEAAATESIVDYLHAMFGDNIRAIVPQLAMSAGTMIACACREIIMGKQSSLGPIDPQLRGLPAHGVIEEFRRAYEEIRADPAKIPVWQPIIAKYNPTLISESEKALQWTEEMVRQWLSNVMFRDEGSFASDRIDAIVAELADHALTKSHARHLSASRCKELGLKVTMMEDDQELQEVILSVHHACIHTLGGTAAFKIIENQEGVAFIQLARQLIVPTPTPAVQQESPSEPLPTLPDDPQKD